MFEFLAFKNDIQFWKSRKTLEGLSVRSVFFNVYQSLVVVLYVFDNETNTIVVVSCAVGLLIELWKITKVPAKACAGLFKLYPPVDFQIYTFIIIFT